MEKSLNILAAIFASAALIVLTTLIVAYPTMWLWNFIVPDIFDLQSINIYQAIAINLLSYILFKNSTTSK